MPVETLFLDAGGVLVFPNWVRVSDALARQGVGVDPAALARAEPFAKKRFDTGTRFAGTTDQQRSFPYFNLVLTEAGIPLDASTDAALDELRAYHAKSNLWEIVPEDVGPALTQLHAMGLRLVVVSNANGTLHACFDRIGLTPYFAAVLDSQIEGIEKPDPRLFQLALDRIGANAETTIHVGDIYHVDVVGARNASIRPVLLDPAGLYEGADCPRVPSLAALCALLTSGVELQT